MLKGEFLVILRSATHSEPSYKRPLYQFERSESQIEYFGTSLAVNIGKRVDDGLEAFSIFTVDAEEPLIYVPIDDRLSRFEVSFAPSLVPAIRTLGDWTD